MFIAESSKVSAGSRPFSSISLDVASFDVCTADRVCSAGGARRGLRSCGHVLMLAPFRDVGAVGIDISSRAAEQARAIYHAGAGGREPRRLERSASTPIDQAR